MYDLKSDRIAAKGEGKGRGGGPRMDQDGVVCAATQACALPVCLEQEPGAAQIPVMNVLKPATLKGSTAERAGSWETGSIKRL